MVLRREMGEFDVRSTVLELRPIELQPKRIVDIEAGGKDQLQLCEDSTFLQHPHALLNRLVASSIPYPIVLKPHHPTLSADEHDVPVPPSRVNKPRILRGPVITHSDLSHSPHIDLSDPMQKALQEEPAKPPTEPELILAEEHRRYFSVESLAHSHQRADLLDPLAILLQGLSSEICGFGASIAEV